MPTRRDEGVGNDAGMRQSGAHPNRGPVGHMGLHVMRRFISRRNIDRYRELLRSELNDERRRTLRTLLDEEERKLAAMDEPDDPAAAPPDTVPGDGHDRDDRKSD
jgi:hypothetical protein